MEDYLIIIGDSGKTVSAETMADAEEKAVELAGGIGPEIRIRRLSSGESYLKRPFTPGWRPVRRVLVYEDGLGADGPCLYATDEDDLAKYAEEAYCGEHADDVIVDAGDFFGRCGIDFARKTLECGGIEYPFDEAYAA